MGYPTKAVKRRRHSRNMKLAAAVVLGGAKLLKHQPPRAFRHQDYASAYSVLLPGEAPVWNTWVPFSSAMGAISHAAKVLGVKI